LKDIYRDIEDSTIDYIAQVSADIGTLQRCKVTFRDCPGIVASCEALITQDQMVLERLKGDLQNVRNTISELGTI